MGKDLLDVQNRPREIFRTITKEKYGIEHVEMAPSSAPVGQQQQQAWLDIDFINFTFISAVSDVISR